MTNKNTIQQVINNFSQGDFKDNALDFFKVLGYSSNKTSALGLTVFLPNLNHEKALVNQWQCSHLLFQLADDDLQNNLDVFSSSNQAIDNTIMQSYIFAAIELNASVYSRSSLVEITRALNKASLQPVLLLFKHGNSLTFSIIHRRINKTDNDKDVLEKVTLLKDIRIENTHRAHLDILTDFSFENLQPQPKNFVELHHAWRKILNISLLNKIFYEKLAIIFTQLVGGERKISSKTIRETGVLKLPSVIGETVKKEFAVRLIGRLLFCWFLKKKQLVPNELLSLSAVNNYPRNYDYYHSVLEPLFFEVLNKESKNRLTIYAQDLWQTIPFLNGGLFEAHIDDFYSFNELNFSDYLNTLIIPDTWFSTLFELLENHHFTIEENTPLEIEIAIEPEMLGRVFENLLAEINPETGANAQKSTGSFYTPREIVDYMVDESLRAYFKSKFENFNAVNLLGEHDLVSFSRQNDLLERLDDLLSFNEATPQFSVNEKAALINAINNCKILDPACGSGAFPMGILQKLVLILRYIDPDAHLWLERILSKTPDPQVRQLMRQKLSGDVDLLDYTRKLGVIRDCIYGADIQPIATEITKLRCFLSLIVDEKIDHSKDNHGIIPLPSLEFKFVCANSLMSLFSETNTDLFECSDSIMRLKELRDEYLTCHEKNRKEEIKQSFKVAQYEMADNIAGKDTVNLATWKPFDNTPCSWFNPDWMFGIKDGFDIVIGNPPYGASYSAEHKKHFQANYVSAKTIKGIQKGSIDTFSLFIEQGFNWLKINGNLNYIVPMAITSSDAMTGLHALLEKNCKTISVSSYSNRPKQVFDNACIRTSILLFTKTGTKNEHLFTTRMIRRRQTDELGELIANLAFIDSRSVKLKGRYPKISTKLELAILQKLFNNGKPLVEFYDVIAGNKIYYRTSGGRYFNVITNYPTGSTQEKAIQVKKELTDFVGAVLSSNLFYFYQQVYSDGLHIKQFEIDSFSIPEVTEEIVEKIERAYSDYLIDIEANIINHHTANYSNISAFKEYKISKSKHLIDKLDDLICPLYGFTQAETDFIKNYEIEYRLSATVDD
ncbi:MAG: N-6 DNA methylase [Methylococcales bacterium]